MLPPIGRIGGKKLLKKRIVERFPPAYQSMVYVEPFIGGGSVFYHKEPSVREVISDIDKGVYLIHNGLKRFSGRLKGKFPHTRDLWDEWIHRVPQNEEEVFMKEYLCSKMSFMCNRTSYCPRVNCRVSLNDYTDRLKDTVIMNEDYKVVMEAYDGPNTLFYLDPPYEGARKTAGYKHSRFDLNAMKTVLDSVQGRWVLSINDGEHIRQLFKDYTIIPITTQYRAPRPRTVVELLITNF
jgi:DNA adenine methylase